ncbi:hypothetical protein NMY22_g16200 [Coprinellus aureogranulatus]|nr:hypothetical protein NMY22_g16200 [Coprinellus aureogranulatus]
MLIAPLKRPKISTAISATLYSSLIFAPFVHHNYAGYMAYCGQATNARPAWCYKAIPLIYTHVQAKYWNGGIFKYWTLQQLPNILLGLPPILLIYAFGYWHLKSAFLSLVPSEAPEDAKSPWANPALTPHVLHGIFTASLLLFASHTQITLRLAASMPVVYWAAAWLWTHTDSCAASKIDKLGSRSGSGENVETSDDDELELVAPVAEDVSEGDPQTGHGRHGTYNYKYRTWAKAWVYWSAIWGAVSVVLWAAFLPPA